MKKEKGFTKDFILVLVGQIISLFGNAILRFALPIHLLNVTGSAAILGVVSGCAFIPLVIMSPIGGLISDRVNRRNIMVCLDFFTSGITVLFLGLYGKVNITGLILITLFLLYGISGAYQPSVQASIPLLVAQDKVMPANAMVNMVSSLSGLLGPALGGLTYSMGGIYPVLQIAAGCFFCSAVMELFIRMPFKKKHRQESLLREAGRDMKQSIVYIVKENKGIGRMTICCAGVNLVLSALMIIGLPVLVMQVLPFSDAKEAAGLYGFMQAILAVGGVIGGMGAGIFSRKLHIEKSWGLLVISGGLLVPMGAILMIPCSAYVSYLVLAVSGLLIMICASIYTIQVMSYIQITVPQDLVGKVISWIIALSTCAQPVGQVVYGVLFEQISGHTEAIFYIAAGLSMFIAWGGKKAAEELGNGNRDYDVEETFLTM